jgi:hypothetical protein
MPEPEVVTSIFRVPGKPIRSTSYTAPNGITSAARHSPLTTHHLTLLTPRLGHVLHHELTPVAAVPGIAAQVAGDVQG